MLENLKKWMQEKIERDAVVSNIYGEKVILKKSMIPIIGGDWKQIHPPVDPNSVEQATDEHGNTDWKKVKWNVINAIFGGWSNFWILVFVLAIVVTALIQYFETVSLITQMQNHPCYSAFSECVKNSLG